MTRKQKANKIQTNWPLTLSETAIDTINDMFKSRSIRMVQAAVLGALFAFAVVEPAIAHCNENDDADGAGCYCLCTQALDAPDVAPKMDSPQLILEVACQTATEFESLTFPPPSPPPWA